jgi:rhamnosyltransferase
LSAHSVCAVIVTYNPSAGMMGNISGILAQVTEVVVVDNGSRSDELKPLRAVSQTLGFHLIDNGENHGIAEGLNQGVLWAKNKKYSWVILFDQDSRVTDSFIPQMFAAWESHPQRERVGSLHPKYLDPDTGFEPPVWRAEDGGPVISLTSGALMPTWIFDKVGWFASEYFVDCVDFEYCFRLRAAGYLIADSRQAVLLHKAGNAQRTLNFLGFSFRPTHHSAMRRYYMSRNRVAVVRKYFRVFPGWISRFMYDCLRETIKCFVGDNNRVPKFYNFLLGTWDGLTGRMGKREGL